MDDKEHRDNLVKMKENFLKEKVWSLTALTVVHKLHLKKMFYVLLVDKQG